MAKCELSSIWPDDLYIVCGAGELIEPGDTSSILDSMKWWKIRIDRAGSPLNFGSNANGSPYFDYDPDTGEVTWSIAAIDTEEYIVKAYKPA